MDAFDQVETSISRNFLMRWVLVGLLLALLMVGGGVVLHLKLNRLMRAQQQIENANLARIDIETVLPQVELFDSFVYLYSQTHSPATLLQARSLAEAIQVGDAQLSNISAPADELDQLSVCAHAIVRATETPGAPDTALLDHARQYCENTLARIREHQRAVWRQRSGDLQEEARSSRAASLLFVVLSTTVVLVSLTMFAHNAMVRKSVISQFRDANKRWASAIEVLDYHAREMKLLADARDQLQMCASTKDAYEVCVHFVAQLLPDSSGALCIIDNSRQMIELQAAWGDNTQISDIFPLDACCGMRTGQPRWRTPDASVVNCSHFNDVPPLRYVCMPLVANGDTLGILYVECVSAVAADCVERNLDTLRALLQLAAMTIAGLNLRAKLENQSIRDSLTGLFNRHFMEITLERELRRATRKNVSLAVFMIDADNFKQFNDKFGHKAGDIVLRCIADRFLISVRTEDIVCRYGGEEFVIILPDIAPEKAVDRAESICHAISNLRADDHGQSFGVVTVSIGVAMYPGDGDTIEQLLQAADRRLYAAKNNGRNQVVSAHSAARVPIGAR